MRPGIICSILVALVSFAPLWSKPVGDRQEVQHHGYVFERWVADSFFGGYIAPSYTQKWDIPASVNTRHGQIPVNPKAVCYGSPVGLGDALRQFEVAEDFLLILGYWQQDGDQKRLVKIIAPRVTPAVYRKLWGPITRADLEKLDAVIKDTSLTPEQARAAAQKLKQVPPFNQAVITLNPKIDGQTQRRLQCSLGFAAVFRYLAPEENPVPEEHPELWGVAGPHPFFSGPRSFSSQKK
jgi:hypothetical protein